MTPAPTPSSPKHLSMVAGEASGDALAALLLAGLRQRWGTFRAWGVGGAAMRAQGFEAAHDCERLAVHGMSLAVLARVPGLLALRARLRREIAASGARVFVGVDAPDFNLRLEQQLRGDGLRTVHFVCPSIWAWRPERVHTLAAAADHVLCLFPFEPDLLAQHGVPATYVGHPMAHTIDYSPDVAAARATLGLDDPQSPQYFHDLDGPVLAILPGSRGSEIAYNTPVFLAAAERLLAQHPRLRCLLPAVPHRHAQVLEMVQKTASAQLRAHLRVVAGHSHTVLAACDATLIASGTATLEAALFKRPMVISYHMHPWSWRWMRRHQLQPWVGLPNILCGDFVVPELLQDAGRPEALAAALAEWLAPQAAARRAALVARFEHLHQRLRCDTAGLAAQVIEELYAR